MKPFALSVVVAIAIGIGAAALLGHLQRLSYQAYSTPSTRVSEPGHNLVGRLGQDFAYLIEADLDFAVGNARI